MKAIIIIPGYKGSFLKNINTNKREWITLYNLFQTESNLALTNKLIEDGIIDKIPILPFINKEVYNNCISFFNKVKGYEIYYYSYDWRQDILYNVKILGQYINNLKEKYNEINIVGHSLGGILTTLYLQDNNHDNINKIILIATPFQGVPRIFYELIKGNKLLFNSILLSNKILQSYPVLYQILSKEVLFLTKNEPIDLYNINNWLKYNLVNDSDLNFIKKNMDLNKQILNRLNKYNKKINLKTLNIISNSYVTFNKFYINIENNNLIYKKNNFFNDIYTDGDSTIPTKYSKLPMYFSNSETMNVKVKHAYILNNKSVINKINEYIRS